MQIQSFTFAPAAGLFDQVPDVEQDASPLAVLGTCGVAGAEVDQEVERGVCSHQQVVEGNQNVKPLELK